MKNEKSIYIVVGVLSVVVCGFLFLRGRHGDTESSQVTFGQVDQLRKETQMRKELESKKVDVDNYKSAPNLSNAYHAVEDETANKDGIRFESEQHSVVKEQVEIEGAREPVNALEVQINKRLLNDQKAAQLSAQQKKQFIADYKKQALAKGYLVELNDQLVVTKVQKVGSAKGPASIPQEDVEIQEYEDEDAE